MTNYNTMLAGLRDLISNPNPRVPVVLCLDVSTSMSGRPIQELNAGVRQYLNEMKGDELTRNSAETAVVTFSNTVECQADFNTADKLQMNDLTTHGWTCMGEGLQMALSLLEKRKNQYKSTGVDYYQPILVVMSDGVPNGDPVILRNAMEEIQSQVTAHKLTVISVGIGNDADMEMMEKLSPKTGAVHMDGVKFREFFAWLSQSVASVSDSNPGDEPELDLEMLKSLEAEPWPDELH